jgi:predicted negative regulator of RcsB-dependent stress response
LLQEAGAEAGATPQGRVRQGLLEAEVARRIGDTNRAIEIASMAVQALDKSVSKDLCAECRLALASLYSEAGRLADARAELKSVGPLIEKTESDRLKAMAARVTGRVLMGEAKPAEAGAQFDNEAALLHQAESYFEMAAALEWAGNAYEKAGDPVMASDRYFRAGRSWLAAGYPEPGDKALDEALGPARMCGNEYIVAQIGRLTNTTFEFVVPAKTTTP